MNTEYMEAALAARVRNPHQKLVLITLAAMSDRFGEVRASHKEIGELSEINHHRVANHTEGLRKKFLVKITKIDGARGRFDAIYSLKLNNILKRTQV